MNKELLEKILGRPEYHELLTLKPELKDKKILITGAKGSIGQRLNVKLFELGANVLPTDIDKMDITSYKQVKDIVSKFNPEIIVNVAGAKHAPEGEHETWNTLEINTVGTKNILDCANGAKVILTSTCKSCNPETVYGASKLIAERMVLNAGGSVARFFNVVESSGNVFELWEKQDILKVSVNCKRHFISIDEAVGLILVAISEKENQRYIVNSPDLRSIYSIAEVCYPNKNKEWISPRRGDRLIEKFMGSNESIAGYLLNTRVAIIKSNNDK